MAETEKTDIVPGLLEQIQKNFDESFAADPVLRALSDRISAGKASYVDAEEFAARTGELLAAALQKNVTADQLPNGKMYYNIAERILGTMLRADHAIVSGIAAEVQASLNERAGLGLKPQIADFDSENAQSIIDKVSAADDFNTRSWMLEAPVVSFSMKVVDDTVKKNADFHYRSGLKPRIIRSAESKCCDWCASLEGTYEYPGVSRDVFRRHNNCRCTVDYDPRSGKVQNVWNKKEWKDAEEYDKIEARKGIRPEDDRGKNIIEQRRNIQRVHFKTQGMPPEEYARAVEEWRKRKEFPLSAKEKAEVFHNFNNNLTDDERKYALIHDEYGNYHYYAVNKGFDNYKIYDRQPIEKIDSIIDDVLTEIFGPDWREYDK